MSIIDVAIDDEPEVYEKVPLQLVTKVISRQIVAYDEDEFMFICKDVFSKSIQNRINEATEQCLILKLFLELAATGYDTIASVMRLAQFCVDIKNSIGDTYEADVLIDVMKELVSAKSVIVSSHSLLVPCLYNRFLSYQHTSTIDIFIAEAIPLCVNKALDRLSGLISDSVSANCGRFRYQNTCICWGNTNLTLSHFREVLAMAERTERPVRFVRW
jgi:hypothetical protein